MKKLYPSMRMLLLLTAWFSSFVLGSWAEYADVVHVRHVLLRVRPKHHRWRSAWRVQPGMRGHSRTQPACACPDDVGLVPAAACRRLRWALAAWRGTWCTSSWQSQSWKQGRRYAAAQ